MASRVAWDVGIRTGIYTYACLCIHMQTYTGKFITRARRVKLVPMNIPVILACYMVQVHEHIEETIPSFYTESDLMEVPEGGSTAMGPAGPLVESFTWAHRCVAYLRDHGKADVLCKFDGVPFSTFFSGYGCAELAVDMINAAVRSHTKKDPFSPTMQYEINARARTAAGERLPQHTCQFVDIQRLLKPEDRKHLVEIEKSSPNVQDDIWEFLLKAKLDAGEGCTKHGQRCSMERFERIQTVVSKPW